MHLFLVVPSNLHAPMVWVNTPRRATHFATSADAYELMTGVPSATGVMGSLHGPTQWVIYKFVKD